MFTNRTRRRGTIRRGGGAGLIIGLMLMSIAGCAVRTPASAVRFAPASDDEPSVRPVEWPAFSTAPIVSAAEAAEMAFSPGTDVPESIQFTERAMRLLRTRHPYLVRGEYGQAVVFESFVVREPSRKRFRIVVNALDEAALIEAALADKPGDLEDDNVFRFTVHLELPARIGDGESPGDGVRGVALHLVSLGNTGFEREVMDELRNRGWAVLRFVPDPFTLRVLAVDRAAPEDPDRMQVVAADDLARQVDDQHAALAEAVGGMLAHLRDARPDVRPDRMAIVGFSLGALAAPAVALRLESVTDALVLVGGGADISTILIRGSLTRFDRAVRGEVRRTLLELPESYRKAAQLDGYNVGPLIRHIPTLIVHASFDAIVPNATGDLLYEQLGRPERWSYPFGHLGLFWWLPNEADEIADWVERATQRAELNERDDECRSTRER